MATARGYRISPNFAFEGGHIDLGRSKYTAAYSGGTGPGSLKAGGLDVVGLAMLPLDKEVMVFAKGGFIAAKIKSD